MKHGGRTKQGLVTWSRGTLHHAGLLTRSLSPLWIKEQVAPGRLRDIMKSGTSLLSILFVPLIQYYNWLQGEHSSQAYWAKRMQWRLDYLTTKYALYNCVPPASFQMNPHLLSIDRMGLDWLPSVCAGSSNIFIYHMELKWLFIILSNHRACLCVKKKTKPFRYLGHLMIKDIGPYFLTFFSLNN